MKRPPVPSNLVKTNPPRGPLQQFRFEEAVAFDCFRCGGSKKSKSIAILHQDWTKRLCNGCYGYLLQLHEIKAGTLPDEDRAEQLAEALLKVVASDDVRKAEALFRASENRAQQLSAEAMRFIATAEHVALGLGGDPQLEWSPAVIGLCKAVEHEVVGRIMLPLSAQVAQVDLSSDRTDRDWRRIAEFCAGSTRKSPELGTIAHFLNAAIHSADRRGTSPLLAGFTKLLANWPGSQWILAPSGLLKGLRDLTAQYRNRAAHTDALSRSDYSACRELVIGDEGLLWNLVLSTRARA